MKKRLIVIGGGAAGFFCAVNAAAFSPQLEVIILERTGKLLSKVRISGGGRCNVTHACFSIPEMIKNYPRGANFLKKSFHHFFTNDTIKWFEDRGVQLKTEVDGRIFPVSDKSESIISCLVSEANAYKVQVMMNRQVVEIKGSVPLRNVSNTVMDDRSNLSTVMLASGELVSSDFVCIACGGFSKRSQFDWLSNLGHSIADPVPSLFTFNLQGNPISSLMGVSVAKANIRIAGTKFSQEGPLLITHWGLSGPAVLKLSAFAAIELSRLNYHYKIFINWIPSYNENTLRQEFSILRLQSATQKIINRNAFQLPNRLWAFLLQQAGIPEDMRWADLPARLQNILIKYLCNHEFVVKGKTTFKEEFVTAGGISPNEIDPNTMKSKIIPNIYFAGEVMNVDGITGGFNFQHAWTSGYLAAKGIVQAAGTPQVP